MNKTPRPWLRCTALLAAGTCVLIAILLLCLTFAAPWLSVEDTPTPSDTILVLAGEPARFLYGADLYKNGLAPQVHVSRPARLRAYKIFDDLDIQFPRFETAYREILIRKGVPAGRIHYLGESLLSTVDEARAANTLAGHTGMKTFIIVTSPYHVRRVKMVFADYAPGLEVAVVATPYEPFPAKWWTDQDVARNVMLELAKIAFYVFGGRFTFDAAGY